MMTFDPKNTYYQVAGDTKVFSTAVGDYVALTDPAYVAWLANNGNIPSIVPSEAGIGEILARYNLRPVNANVLDGYTGAQADTIIAQTIFKILFNHENRLRACERALALNGSPANLTPAQARATVKALM